MSPYPHPLLAREGWPYIGAVVVVAALTSWLAGWAWSVPLWLAAAAFLIVAVLMWPSETKQEPEAPSDASLSDVS